MIDFDPKNPAKPMKYCGVVTDQSWYDCGGKDDRAKILVPYDLLDSAIKVMTPEHQLRRIYADEVSLDIA